MTAVTFNAGEVGARRASHRGGPPGCQRLLPTNCQPPSNTRPPTETSSPCPPPLPSLHVHCPLPLPAPCNAPQQSDPAVFANLLELLEQERPARRNTPPAASRSPALRRPPRTQSRPPQPPGAPVASRSALGMSSPYPLSTSPQGAGRKVSLDRGARIRLWSREDPAQLVTAAGAGAGGGFRVNPPCLPSARTKQISARQRRGSRHPGGSREQRPISPCLAGAALYDS